MKTYLVMGLFALYVVAISLGRYLREEEFFRLTAMKRIWGRSRGLAIYFVSNVALPLVLGIIFISQAVVHDRPGPGASAKYGGWQLKGTVISEPSPEVKGMKDALSRPFPSTHFLSDIRTP